MPEHARQYLKIDPQAVVGIILGCRITAAAREVVEAVLNERQEAGMPQVRIYEARKHERKYELVVHRAP